MLDIMEIAHEEGLKEGKTLGVQEGKSLGLQEGKTLGLHEGKAVGLFEGMQSLIIEALIDRFGLPPARILERVREIRHPDLLKGAFHQALKCQTIQEFEAALTPQ